MKNLTKPMIAGLESLYAGRATNQTVYTQDKDHCHCCYFVIRNKSVADALMRRGLVEHGTREFEGKTYTNWRSYVLTDAGVQAAIEVMDPHTVAYWDERAARLA